jgi:hypothetical protein
MRRLVVLSICLLALMPAFDAAQAAGSQGTVSKTWVSRTNGGVRETKFSASAVKKLYANFVWKVPAAPGQKLRIEWRDPNGVLSAVWRNKTIKSDKEGTRLYAWVKSTVVKGKFGTWRTVLIVGGKQIGASTFRVVA